MQVVLPFSFLRLVTHKLSVTSLDLATNLSGFWRGDRFAWLSTPEFRDLQPRLLSSRKQELYTELSYL